MNSLKKLLAMFMLVCLMVGLLPAGAAYAGAADPSVTFNCSPADLTLTVDGTPVAGTAARTILLTAGDHNYTASRNGYVTKTDVGFNITASGSVDVSLDVRNYSMTFNCTPSDLTLRVKEVGGSEVAPSGGTYTLAGNKSYTYTASKDGFTTLTDQPITLADGSVDVTLYELFDVTFTCSPADMTLTPSGGTLKSGGGTATRVYSMINGSYTYSASATGHEAKTSVPFTVSGATPVAVTLDPVYTVTFNGPAGAVVSVTGGSLGAPQAVTLTSGTGSLNLKTGSYSYTATCAHYEPITTPVSLPVETAAKTVTVTMTPITYTVNFKDSDGISALPAGTTLTVKNSGGTTVNPTTVGGSSYSLKAGNYTYDASRTGCETKTGVPFTVSAAADIPVTLDPVYAVTFAAASSAPALTGSTVTVSTGGTAVKTMTSGYVCDLKSGSYTYTAARPGYTASGSFDVTSAARNVEVTLAACTTHTDSNSDGKCDNCGATIVATVNSVNYITLAAAYAAASEGDTITLVNSPSGNDGSLTIAKDITLVGSGKTLGIVTVSSDCTLSGFTASAIVVTGGAPQLSTVTATGLTASGTATPALTSCNITTLVSGTTATIYVASGTYGTAGTGLFSIYGGTFDNDVDATKCVNGGIQYYAKKNNSNKYDIEVLVPAISTVTNSGEFVKNAATTLSFTTNIPDEIKAKILSVKVGDNPLTATTDYTVTGVSGNTVVNLTNAYLRSIANCGTYTLTVTVQYCAANATKDFVVSPVAGSVLLDENDVSDSVDTTFTTAQPGVTMSTAAINKSVTAGKKMIITTSGGTVAFDADAMAAIKANSAGGSVTLKITKGADTAAGGKTFTLTLQKDNGAAVSFSGGTAMVTLNVGSTCPARVDHKHGNTTDKYFLNGATGTAIPTSGAKRFSYSSPNATLIVTSFSSITTTPASIDIGTGSQLPNAIADAATDTAYGPITFRATGGTGYSWTLTAGSDAAGTNTFSMTSAGVLTGTIPAGLPEQRLALTVKAVDTANSANTVTEDFYISVVAAGTVYEVRPANGDPSSFHTTFANAQAAAAAGDTILMTADDPATAITVSKDVNIYGNGHKVNGSIAVTGGSPTFNNVKANSLTAGGTAAPTLTGCTITELTSNDTANVKITSGTYGGTTNTINGTGDYTISGGTFGEKIYPIDCLRDTSTTPITQYYSVASGANKWTVGRLSPEITKVSNSAYFMRRSTNTLAFTTNIPASLVDGTVASDITSVVVPQDSATALTASRYTVYSTDGTSTGDAVIALSNSYLRTLDVGTYTLEINTREGVASAKFTVGNTVKTGDEANMPLWLGLMGGSVLVLCGAAAYIMLKNKKKKKK